MVCPNTISRKVKSRVGFRLFRKHVGESVLGPRIGGFEPISAFKLPIRLSCRSASCRQANRAPCSCSDWPMKRTGLSKFTMRRCNAQVLVGKPKYKHEAQVSESDCLKTCLKTHSLALRACISIGAATSLRPWRTVDSRRSSIRSPT
jgi:hypothetical protein